ncbi:hypothetical protein [Vibrio coralliirubri]|uniref:hypothetical protein n=1 Tax=Vibrio coralliirubri TaxID=1516159 RepID=UPI0006329B3E|nr:hypothetical protein [Vibrio coralliirubri]CDT38492.1 conserved exported hypothetical protein [Vibrio coralliirubri]
MLRFIVAFTLFSLSNCTLASNNHSTLSFKKHVRERCGLEVINNQGEMSFGREYDGRAITLKLESNRKDSRLLLKLQHIDLGSIDESRISELVRFKVETPARYEGDINYWRQGVEFPVDQLASNKEVDIRARITIPESQLTAGEFHFNMEWAVECL